MPAAAPPPTAPPPKPAPAPAPSLMPKGPGGEVINPFTQAKAAMEKLTGTEPAKPASPASEAKPAAKPAETKAAEPKAPEAPKSVEQKATVPKPEEKPAVEGKTSPWKLLDTFKSRNLALEKELAELRNRVPDPVQAETFSKRLEGAEKRSKELEEEIRYVNYAKSQEFRDKYQKPYEEAWAKAVTDLNELDVMSEDGSPSRKATASDLLALSNMPLGEARKLANAMFGDAADDVMAHRRRVRDLSDAQSKALDEARKTGSERQQRDVETGNAIKGEVARLWHQFNSEDSEKYDFLKPREDDEEWNGKLEKAKTLVDGAFAASPHDPKLTPEARADIVRKHAAVRNRAIAYSSLRLEVTRLKHQLASKDEELKQYQASAPGKGNGSPEAAKGLTPSDPMVAARKRLEAMAF